MSILNRLLLLVLLLPLAARAIPLLTLAGPPGGVTAGSSFGLQLRVDRAEDLYGYQFDLRFDPSLLSATAVSEGPMLPDTGPTLFLPGVIDNAAGSILFIAGSLVGPIAGADGAGLLLTFDFRALAAGNATIALDNALLIDSTLTASVPLTPPVTLPIGPPVGLPLPGSPTLVLTGLIALYLGRRRCQKN